MTMPSRKAAAALALLAAMLAALAGAALAHTEPENGSLLRLDEFIRSTSLAAAAGGLLLIAALVAAALAIKRQSEAVKVALFALIASAAILVTLYLGSTTVYLNAISSSRGPVHWHADFEIYRCGERVDLVDPEGLSNRVGTPVLHEHGDDRIHVEGVVVRRGHIDLHSFFEAVGGTLDEGRMAVPTGSGMVEMRDGEMCGGAPGRLQAFLYRVRDPDPTAGGGFLIEQVKLEGYAEYVPSPFTNVPPGDCIIFEFGPEAERTGRICESIRVAAAKGAAEVG